MDRLCQITCGNDSSFTEIKTGGQCTWFQWSILTFLEKLSYFSFMLLCVTLCPMWRLLKCRQQLEIFSEIGLMAWNLQIVGITFILGEDFQMLNAVNEGHLESLHCAMGHKKQQK